MTISNFVANLLAANNGNVQQASAAPVRKNDTPQQPAVKGGALAGQNGTTISNPLGLETAGLQQPTSKFASMIHNISQQPVENFEGMSFFDMMKNPPADERGFAGA